MLLLKACPHCGGDLATEQDRACGYLECVQCSHVLSRDQERALGVRISRRGVLTHEAPRRTPARRAQRRTRALQAIAKERQRTLA